MSARSRQKPNTVLFTFINLFVICNTSVETDHAKVHNNTNRHAESYYRLHAIVQYCMHSTLPRRYIPMILIHSFRPNSAGVDELIISKFCRTMSLNCPKVAFWHVFGHINFPTYQFRVVVASSFRNYRKTKKVISSQVGCTLTPNSVGSKIR